MVSRFSDIAVKKREEDKLGFNDYAEGIIATIERVPEEDTPFTVAIFGPWGSGKTSLMWLMKDILTSKGYETIFFNSWEYGNEEKPWIPFMIQVVEELFKKEIDRKELVRNIFLFSTDMVLQYYSQGKLSTGSILDLFKKSGKTSPFREWSDEDVKAVIERVTKIREFKEKIEERAGIEKRYLFNWEEIPGNDSERLTHFLKTNYDVDWVKTAKIAKIDNHKTIMITAEKNFLSLNLNNENTELNLKIDNVKIDEFIVKTENGKLNIYKKAKSANMRVVFVTNQNADWGNPALLSTSDLIVPNFDDFKQWLENDFLKDYWVKPKRIV